MKRLQCALALAAVAAVACSQQQPTVDLRSLESSGRVSFVCLGPGSSNLPGPRNLDDCRDRDPLDDEARTLFALVTQKTRGEVAVVEVFGGARATGRVVDLEPTVPGNNFLPIGAKPTSIVSTPGGVATFVGVAEPGREGIFALPSTCIMPRREDETVRDLTTWPACRLPSAPGDMVVLVDRADRAVCDAQSDLSMIPPGEAATRDECPADMALEMEPPGRRKLVVALPDLGELAVLDAQAVLDVPPGAFPACPIESIVPLRVDLPAVPVPQRLPPDLDLSACEEGTFGGRSAEPDDFVPRPSRLALSEGPHGSRLFVADLGAPVIHVRDAGDPCNLPELPPLFPTSFVDPDEPVFTSSIAVGPPTTDGRRFLYAVDALGGGVMVFDVSPESGNRTPIVRPRSKLMPFEPPDRIAFDAPARDVELLFIDQPAVLRTGVAPDRTFCDPDPGLPSSAPGVAERPSRDLSRGARPDFLRGVFGFVALDSGQIAVIDVEDLDGPCRRPAQVNPGPVEDFRGCANDPFTEPLIDPGSGRPTVTDELSCRIVQPHRSRSASLFVNSPDRGVRAPALRAFPRLTSERGRALPTDQTDEGLNHPKMLGVNFSEEQPAQVFVGTTRHEARRDGAAEELVIDPARADSNSLVLSFAEPRAYPPVEEVTAVFEGLVVGERPPVGRLSPGPADADTTILEDTAGFAFCDRGVQDVPLARDMGRDAGVEDEEDLERFARQHADVVVITQEIPDEDDAYWSGFGATCGDASPAQPGAGRLECRGRLGTPGAPTDWRELRILEASASELVVEPRHYASARERDFKRDLLECCFPGTVSYTIRGANQWIVRGSVTGFQHDVTTDEAGQCVRDCNPLRSGVRGRALEISCDPELGDGCFTADGEPIIGLSERESARRQDVACRVGDPRTDAQTLGEHPCIFANVTTRFAIYRGRRPSERGMTFRWEVVGGFVPRVVDLTTTEGGAATLPRSIVFSPQARRLAVTDGANKGLVLISLADLPARAERPFGVRLIF